MTMIIVAFPRLEDAKAVRNILIRMGYSVAACSTGAQAVNLAYSFSDGIIICGYKLSDMTYSELFEYRPKGFELILASSPNMWTNGVIDEVFCVALPLKTAELVHTLEAIQQLKQRRQKKKRLQPALRVDEERKNIDAAKEILIKKNHMSEPEAHRYLQKCSMESGNSMTESALMIISMYS